MWLYPNNTVIKKKSMDERYSFQQMMLEQLDILMQKINFNLNLTCYTRVNSKGIIEFKCKTTKFLEENVGENLQDLGLGEKFLDITPKAWSIKEKKKVNWTWSKSKAFALKKMLLGKWKEATDGEKLFANHISHKGFIHRTHKVLSKLNSKKANILIRKWAKDISPEDIQAAISTWKDVQYR